MTSPLIALENPFRNVIVNDPWQFLETDVHEIHHEAFVRCCAAVKLVRNKPQTTSLLIHGEAGSGKTHLLARLWAHLLVEAEADGPGGLQQAVFVPLRMHTNGSMIWRFLRREFAKSLLQSDGGVTQLDRLLLRHLTPLLKLSEENFSWLKKQQKSLVGVSALGQYLAAVFDERDRIGLLELNLRKALTLLLQQRHRNEAAAWLRGESLPKETLDQLGIAEDAESDPEQAAARVVLGLASLATGELPIIFSFDQVEALQTHPQDFTGLHAFGQLAATLYSETKHCLLISCVQSAYLDLLQQRIREADWQRMVADGAFALKPLNWDLTKQLVKARLDLLPALKELRAVQAAELWPLAENEVRAVLTDTGIVTRRLLAHCAELFEAQRRDASLAAPERFPTEVFLQKVWEYRKESALQHNTAKETDEILADGLARLLPLTQREWQIVEAQPVRDVEIVLQRQGKRVGVSLCNSASGTSLAAKLRRLQTAQKQFDELLLLRDTRLPCKSSWLATKQYRQELQERGAQWHEPSPECLATLDALRNLLAEAQAGDLANGGATVTAQSLREWLLQNLQAELRYIEEGVLLAESEPVPDFELREKLAELLQRYHVIRVDDAAAMLEKAEASVAACAHTPPERFGVLGQPPAALFEHVN